MTPNQQKAMKKQFTEEKRRTNDVLRKIDSAVVAMVRKDLEEHEEWSKHVEEAERWQAANDAARDEYETAKLEDDAEVMLESLHAIHDRTEGSFMTLLRKAEAEISKSDAAERRAARAAAREQDEAEAELVSRIMSCVHCVDDLLTVFSS